MFKFFFVNNGLIIAVFWSWVKTPDKRDTFIIQVKTDIMIDKAFLRTAWSKKIKTAGRSWCTISFGILSFILWNINILSKLVLVGDKFGTILYSIQYSLFKKHQFTTHHFKRSCHRDNTVRFDVNAITSKMLLLHLLLVTVTLARKSWGHQAVSNNYQILNCNTLKVGGLALVPINYLSVLWYCKYYRKYLYHPRIKLLLEIWMHKLCH